MTARDALLNTARLKVWEPLFWAAAFVAPWVLSQHALILNEIAIVALFGLGGLLYMASARVLIHRLGERRLAVNGAALRAVRDGLLSRGTLSGSDVRAIMAAHPPTGEPVVSEPLGAGGPPVEVEAEAEADVSRVAVEAA